MPYFRTLMNQLASFDPAEREAARLADIARKERELVEKAAREVSMEVERKAKRDARYAARKAR